jgi:recombination protein RecA
MKENKDLFADELKETLKSIKKAFGEGSIMVLGDRSDIKVDTIPSGSLLLDVALGVGGYPRGRIIEIYGPESSGKTTFALQAIAEVQKNGGRAAFIDAEHAIDPVYAQTLGVCIDELILSQPDYGEQALEIASMLTKSNAIDLIVVDSVAALVPQAELEGDMIDQQVGMQARLMSKALRKLAGNLNNNRCSIIFINQLREKVGIMFGNPEVTPGGRALKFYASIRLEVRRGEQIKNGPEAIGNVVNIKVVKNKVAAPFKSCSVELIYGKGIAKDKEILDLATRFDIIKKTGSWYQYNENKLGQGPEKALVFLHENPTIFEEITLKVKETLTKE